MSVIWRSRAPSSAPQAPLNQDALVKEVHHRVKNNLQLINSILHLEIRNANAPEAIAPLHRTQNRVMALAAAHRHLYETTRIGDLMADDLLREIAGRRGPASLSLSLDPVQLGADQAQPLTLFLGEAMAAETPDGAFAPTLQSSPEKAGRSRSPTARLPLQWRARCAHS